MKLVLWDLPQSYLQPYQFQEYSVAFIILALWGPKHMKVACIIHCQLC